MKSALSRNKILVPQPRSRFLIVECPNCGHKQIVYSHSSFSSRCLSCGALLVKPTGGKAQILGKIEKILS